MDRKKLKDLCIDDQYGIYGIPASAEEFESSKVRYLRITDISDEGKLLNNDKKSVSDKNIDKYILKENDIVFARTGNSTGRAYYHEKKNGELAFAGFLIKYSLDPNKVNPKYIRYYTVSKVYKKWVENLSLGSTRGNINATTFSSCSIFLPRKTQQDLLVETLTYLDEKIDLNNKINQELESMVQTLYNYWFIQFDFSNENEKPYRLSNGKMTYNKKLKREIPYNWEDKKLNELITISKRSIDPSSHSNQKFKYFSIPVFDETKMYKLEKGKAIKSNKYSVTNEDILISKLNPWFSRVVYPLDDEDMICSTEFVVCKSQDEDIKNFIYWVAKSQQFKDYCTQSATGTSNSHKRVSPDIMTSFKVPYNEEIVKKFAKKVDPINKMIVKNIYDNQKLAELRDWLLPMLMNGQVTIKDNEYINNTTDHY